ncbi:hypothetical protein HGRIS_005278 [Hohenbuehelia grisea]|uniref:Uncharacterized protein n=1 Tax=Hohenbuehelia grisea TaxID=104357 RepID=A0ABR3JEI0_9AGAR
MNPQDQAEYAAYAQSSGAYIYTGSGSGDGHGRGRGYPQQAQYPGGAPHQPSAGYPGPHYPSPQHPSPRHPGQTVYPVGRGAPPPAYSQFPTPHSQAGTPSYYPATQHPSGYPASYPPSSSPYPNNYGLTPQNLASGSSSNVPITHASQLSSPQQSGAYTSDQGASSSSSQYTHRQRLLNYAEGYGSADPERFIDALPTADWTSAKKLVKSYTANVRSPADQISTTYTLYAGSKEISSISPDLNALGEFIAIVKAEIPDMRSRPAVATAVNCNGLRIFATSCMSSHNTRGHRIRALGLPKEDIDYLFRLTKNNEGLNEPGNCAEWQAFPGALRATQGNGKVMATSSHVDRPLAPKRFCIICQMMACMFVRAHQGMTIVDCATQVVYNAEASPFAFISTLLASLTTTFSLLVSRMDPLLTAIAVLKSMTN